MSKDQDTEIYKIACEYKAMTELYDRTLTDERNPHDSTEAYLSDSYSRKASNIYVTHFRQRYDPMLWECIQEEIKKYRHYTAQTWIDEYQRLCREKDKH